MTPLEDTSTSLFRENLHFERAASKTYGVDFDKKRALGFYDGLEALKMYIFKVINTQKNKFIIYDSFGLELEDLFGMDIDYVFVVLSNRLKSALLLNDDILDVFDFKMLSRKPLEIGFTVKSVYDVFEEVGTWEMS